MVLDDFNVEGLSLGGFSLEQGHHISGDKFAFFCYFFLAMTPTSTSFLAMILTSMKNIFAKRLVEHNQGFLVVFF